MSILFGEAPRVRVGALLLPVVISCGSAAGASNQSLDSSKSGESATFAGDGEAWATLAPDRPFWLPTNGDPLRQIRFDSPEGAEARRAKLVEYIWGGPLPDARPTVTTDVDMPVMTDVDPEAVERVDVLDVEIADTSLQAFSYVLYPADEVARADARVVIIHQGHAHDFGEAGLGLAATRLLQKGFIVVAMHMPLYGWNAFGRIRSRSHPAMFDGVPNDELGRVFRPFVEPVIQTVNWLVDNVSSLRDVSMIGVSGGGWTTAMAAAVDPRLRYTMQVAGSAPLYMRAAIARDVGDREQFEPTLFAEDIAADGTGGGVATWLEIDALGGYGPGRRAAQVTNEFDPCCFAGRFAESYASIVSREVEELGAGSWRYTLDSTHDRHQISEWAMENVFDPLVEE